MATFRMTGERKLGSQPLELRNNFLSMNKKGTVRFSMGEVEVELDMQSGLIPRRRYLSRRGVIEAPDGAQVLPYFRNSKGWQLIMVEQFRIAIPAQTIEPPGGEVDYTDIKKSMAKELEEEAMIVVDPNKIDLVFDEFIQPSMMAAVAWGGIVEIQESQISANLLGGEWQFGEYTVVTIKPLISMLLMRDERKIRLDLWTSRLLDEVAKKIGLLKKLYQKEEDL